MSAVKTIVKIEIRLREWLTAELSNRQGDPISPLPFISLLQRVTETRECTTAANGINVHGVVIKDLHYAHDVYLLAKRKNWTVMSYWQSTRQVKVKSMGYRSLLTRARLWFSGDGQIIMQPLHLTQICSILECVTEFICLGGLITSYNEK